MNLLEEIVAGLRPLFSDLPVVCHGKHDEVMVVNYRTHSTVSTCKHCDWVMMQSLGEKRE